MNDLSGKTVLIDFDGTITTYENGWQGETVINDPIVPGMAEAITQLSEAGMTIAIFSTRASSNEGRVAIAEYLVKHDVPFNMITDQKLPAIAIIDDRAIQFNGNASSLVDQLRIFQPWHKGIKLCAQ